MRNLWQFPDGDVAEAVFQTRDPAVATVDLQGDHAVNRVAGQVIRGVLPVRDFDAVQPYLYVRNTSSETQGGVVPIAFYLLLPRLTKPSGVCRKVLAGTESGNFLRGDRRLWKRARLSVHANYFTATVVPFGDWTSSIVREIGTAWPDVTA